MSIKRGMSFPGTGQHNENE